MATVYEGSYSRIFSNVQQEINFQTSETSIPAVNYYTIDELRNFTNGNGIKGISVVLQLSRWECYYGNRNAIVLPLEIGSSVSGKLLPNFKYALSI